MEPLSDACLNLTPENKKEWLSSFAKQLKPTVDEHNAEIIRVHSKIRAAIIKSEKPIYGPQMIDAAMNSTSLYESIAYGLIALRTIELMHTDYGIPIGSVNTIKNRFKTEFNKKIPGGLE